MKIFKRIGCVLMMVLVTINPIISLYAVTTNERQIVQNGGSKTQDGVTISKTISASTIENYFDISLKVKTQELAREQDIAVVIVTDISNSMIGNQGSDGKTRLRAAITAASEFISDFQKYSKDTTASRKLGYVSFNTDGHKVFDLQEVKTTAKVTDLTNKVTSETVNIVKDIDNLSSYDSELYTKYTNIEAGLKMAEDMLYSEENKNIQNKYIILLSDGFPTTYLNYNESGYKGYKNRMNDVDFTASKNNHYIDGVFFDDVSNKSVLYGADYSDKGAIRAQTVATRIKNKGTIIYSVGTGLTDSSRTVDWYVDFFKNSDFSTVDRTSSNYVVGKTVNDFKKWLGGNGNTTNPGIGSGYANHYFDTSDTSSLENAYKKIFDSIKEVSEASWVGKDPMNTTTDEELKNIIGFVGMYDKTKSLKDTLTVSNTSDNTAYYDATTDTIKWDLKKSNYISTRENNNGVVTTYYEYELKYRVRLVNENSSFVSEKVYKTNATTTLTYVHQTNGSIPITKTMEFDIPSVKGYLGRLEFTKKSSFLNNNLGGIEFELKHSSECECLNERKHMDANYKLTSTSASNGLVSFNNVPSGHKYVLHETKTDEYHILDTNNYNVLVSYGTTTSSLTNNEIINIHKTNSLTLEKIVDGVETNKEFTFKITAKYNTNNLTGEYSGLLNNKETKITFTNGIAEVKLKNKDKLVINGLPYSMKYTVSEINSDGFIVKYKINDETYVYNSTTLENVLSKDTIIKYTNISSYELPKTGSSAGLIMMIIGSLLLVVPVIYIGKNTLRKADN